MKGKRCRLNKPMIMHNLYSPIKLILKHKKRCEIRGVKNILNLPLKSDKIKYLTDIFNFNAYFYADKYGCVMYLDF